MKKGILYETIESLYLKFPGNLAIYCQLTGVYNDNWLNRVGIYKYSEENVYISIVSIDDLKDVNNEKGYEEGNRLIKQIANTLMKIPVEKDICRYYGDKFLIISIVSMLSYLKEMNYNLSYGECYKTRKDGFLKATNTINEIIYFQRNQKERKENDL